MILGTIDGIAGLFERLLHAQDDFHAGEVDAEVARQREDHFELADLVLSVQTRVAGGARRLDQPFTLIQTKSLRMDVVSLGDHRDHHVTVCSSAWHW